MTLRCLALLIPLLIFGCKTKKEVESTVTSTCNVEGTVKDFTGLDACTFLIVDRKGKKYLPAEGVGDFKMVNGQKINFSYTALPDMMSSCMAEDFIVKLTCIEAIGAPPIKKECVKVSTPFKSEWIKNLNDKYRPYQINRYDYLDGYAYFFSSREMNYLYDCQGDMICQYEAKEKGKCAARVDGLENEVVIWIID